MPGLLVDFTISDIWVVSLTVLDMLNVHADGTGCFTVMTLNMWGSSVFYHERLESLAREVLFLNPDALCLQEVMFFPDGSNSAQALAELVGMPVAALSRSGLGQLNEHGNAILSALPVLDDGSVLFDSVERSTEYRSAAHALLKSASGRLWRVASTHLAWGSHAELLRREQLAAVVEHLAEIDDQRLITAVVCGDMNTTPASQTLRYAAGLDGGDPPTLFLDAFSISGDGEGVTSDPRNTWASIPAGQVGILNPDMLPRRRIDYVLVRGYVHGRPGYPVRCRLVCTPRAGVVTPSDHYGILAELWDPSVESQPVKSER